MYASKMVLNTLKDTPQEAKIASHILLLRAGMMKQEVAGVYNYLPMGLRVLNKIENIIREEMDDHGGQEILCSAVQPKEVWEESGRWSKYGPELFRFKDRHDREFCLGPTHEEIFTTIAKDLIKSSKQLPLNLYQIQTKYRDEARPRFGLMRSREFIMKDAYTFDKDEEGLDKSYNNMADAYNKIFTRCGLKYEVVLADTGNIGGNGSHQFMALSEVGESDIAYCDCGFAADVEKAWSKPEVFEVSEGEITKVHTPNMRTIEEVAEFLNVDKKALAKTIIYHDYTNEQFVAVMVRGDREVNEIKVINELGCNEYDLVLATPEEIVTLGSIHGFCGPKGLNIKVLVDEEVAMQNATIVGANERDYHLTNVKFERDFNGTVGFFRKAMKGDICPICDGRLNIERGIEVGQIFKLQTKYSEPMKATYVNEENKNVPYVMGCYGIGVTRTMSAIIEQYHDEHGIIWPLQVAPYHAVIVPISTKDESQVKLAEELYKELKKNKVEVILDDRDAKPGFKFKDWELIGIPYIITVGRRANEGVVEFKERKDVMNKMEKTTNEVVDIITTAVKNI